MGIQIIWVPRSGGQTCLFHLVRGGLIDSCYALQWCEYE